jgi:hypothetical protein
VGVIDTVEKIYGEGKGRRREQKIRGSQQNGKIESAPTIGSKAIQSGLTITRSGKNSKNTTTHQGHTKAKADGSGDHSRARGSGCPPAASKTSLLANISLQPPMIYCPMNIYAPALTYSLVVPTFPSQWPLSTATKQHIHPSG